MEMIPTHSPNFNVLPEYWSANDRHQYFVNISLSRAYYKFQNNRSLSSSPNSFETPLYRSFDGAYFMTQIYIGDTSGSYSTYVLIDTGESDTWIQCEGCQNCFAFKGKKYDYKLSPHYSRISYLDQLCVEPKFEYEGTCGFNREYYTGQTVKGFVGKDNFYFKNSRTQNMDVYEGIAFGCAFETDGLTYGGPNSGISGILGLGTGVRSFNNQLKNYIKGRFSYCLPPFDEKNPRGSTIYFGDDAQISGDATRLVQVISMKSGSGYYLYLNGISVDGIRLPIDPSVFAVDPSHTKGFLLDSGAPYTMLDKKAYNVLIDYMAKYFYEKYNWHPESLAETRNMLCYREKYPSDYSGFPSMILHFLRGPGEEVNMILGPEKMFSDVYRSDGFCMMVLRSDYPGVSIFGSFQQANFNFLFDVYNDLLYFVPQRC